MGKKASADRTKDKKSEDSEIFKVACMICGKCFKHEQKMKIHLRIHTGETPYPCPHCKKAFSQSSTLKVHVRTHTGERPFSCETCKKSFSRADHLSQHVRTHTGEKPYECILCQRAFATWSALSRHKLEHTSKESFQCTVCQKKFSRGDNLRSHLLKCHSKLLDDKSTSETKTNPVNEQKKSDKREEDVSELLATLAEEGNCGMEHHFLVADVERIKSKI